MPLKARIVLTDGSETAEAFWLDHDGSNVYCGQSRLGLKRSYHESGKHHWTAPDGTILHYDGTQWSTMESGTSVNLFDVWGRSSTDIYAVGEDTILHYDGIQWSAVMVEP
jgi:hypothetical protein